MPLVANAPVRIWALPPTDSRVSGLTLPTPTFPLGSMVMTLVVSLVRMAQPLAPKLVYIQSSDQRGHIQVSKLPDALRANKLSVFRIPIVPATSSAPSGVVVLMPTLPLGRKAARTAAADVSRISSAPAPSELLCPVEMSDHNRPPGEVLKKLNHVPCANDESTFRFWNGGPSTMCNLA
jgi:hypothetical protein